MKVVAIIQARMGSTRLPGKILKQINGKSLLEYQVERLKLSNKIDQLVIATTGKSSDDQIVDFCEKREIAFFRGSEEDVLSRYYETAKYYKADIIVRLTSDCPIIDPQVIDSVIDCYLNNNFDYVSNTLERTFPRGMDTEVFSFDTLRKVHNQAKENFEREHVTPYIYLNDSLFTLYNVANKTNEGHHRWTVDTKEDFILIEKIINELYEQKVNFTIEDTLFLLSKNRNWVNINAHIEQKKLGV